jgi:nicotinamide-nucleotide amidase
MFTRQVVPLLNSRMPLPPAYACQTLRSTGIGESVVEERIAPALAKLVDAGLEIGYCARPGEVDVRLVSRGPGAEARVLEAGETVRALLGASVYAAEDELLEVVVVRTLAERGETLAIAESCTGGLVAHRLTNVPGASAVLRAGWIVYSNEAKQRCLGVSPATLAAHGAVSEATAREMAEGARREAGATYAIAVTGIAGPSGGSPEKPVGTAWLAVAGANGTQTVKVLNPMDRETFKQVTSQQALDLVRRAIPGR